MRTALGYTRISFDRDGRELGVDRQAEAMAHLAKTRRLRLVDTVVENDTSATKGERARWKAVLDRLRSREVDVLVIYSIDRAVRRRKDVADLLDVCAAAGIDIYAVNGGEFATSTPAGRMAAGIVGMVAQNETEQMAMRMRAANEQRAARGEHNPRGSRTYGYSKDGEPIADELAVVREVFDRVGAGEAVYSIAADLAARGFTTTRGRPFTRATVRYIAANDRYLGRTTLKRWTDCPDGIRRRVAVISGPSATTDPVVDEATFARANAVLAGRVTSPRPRARWLLVSGVGTCHCGAPLGTYGTADRTFYRCSADTQHGSRLAARIDQAVVADLVIPRLVADRGVRRRDEDALQAAERDLQGLAQREADLGEQVALGTLSAAAYATATAAIERQRRMLTEKVSTLATAPVIDVPAGAKEPEVTAAWEALSVQEQREVIRRLFRLSMGRAGRGRWDHPLLGFTITDATA